MENNRQKHAKVKKLVMRIERHRNNIRKTKSVVAVLQMLDLYHRKLQRAQSEHFRIAPWSKAVLSSEEADLVKETLFVKGKSVKIGFLSRLAESTDNQHGSMTAVIEHDDRSLRKQETSLFSPRTRLCAKNVKYDTSLFDHDGDDDDDDDDDADNDDDDDDDGADGFGKGRSAKKSRKNPVAGWLSRKFSVDKQKGASQGRKLQFVELEADAEGTESNDVNDNLTKKTDIENERNRKGTNQEVITDKDEEKEAHKDTGLSLKSRVLKVLGKSRTKEKLKRELESDVLVDDGGLQVAGTDCSRADHNVPTFPQKKRKRLEEQMFSCPMCNGKFIEAEINQHAFSCNAEPPRESRWRNRNTDLHCLDSESGFSSAARSKPNGTAKENDYSEWQSACEKISTGKRKNNRKEGKESVDCNHETSFRKLASDSVSVNEQSAHKEEVINKTSAPLSTRRPAKRQVGNVPSKVSKRRDHSNWMSDDSDEEHANAEHLIDEYGHDGMRDSARGNEKRRRRRANFVEEDSIDMNDNDEKCFICSRTLHGKSKSEYEEHVMECIEKEEKKMKRSENGEDHQFVQNFKVDSREVAKENGSFRPRLAQRLGNRKSWIKFDQGDDINEEFGSEEDSPIKTFKPVGESSIFKFDRQFKGNTKEKIKRKARQGKRKFP